MLQMGLVCTLLLISWTASFLFVSMQRFWEDEPGAGPFRASAR